MTQAGGSAPQAQAADLAERLIRRRAELGIGVEEVARRAGLAVERVKELERDPDARPDDDDVVVTRLARALETTPASLIATDLDRPAGPGRAGLHPVLRTLSPEECEAHLRGGGLGRVVFVSDGVPVALPVNYRLRDGEVVFRTSGDTSISRCFGRVVSFEVDRVDEAVSEGWSVLVTGRAELVEANQSAPYVRLGIEPWAGGYRDVFVRIVASGISGRAIHQRSR